MRIGVLTTGFPRHETDSAGVFVRGLARALVARGHSLEVLAPEPAERVAPPAGSGIDVRWVPYARPRALERTFYGAGVPDNVVRDPRAWPGLASFPVTLTLAARRAVADWDAVLSHWGLPCGLAAGLVRGGRPHVAILHSADVHLLGALPGRRRVADALAMRASTLAFTCELHRARFLGWLSPRTRAHVEARTVVQPMGVDATAVVDRVEARRALGMHTYTLLTIGRLVPVKGLVEAARAIAPLGDVELWIAGDGPERGALERVAAEHGARIRLLGSVHGARKAALLSAADGFVLPSRSLATGRSEGVPASLAEAMAAGLPVIASAVGGIPEHVTDGVDGLLFDPACGDGLREAVARLRHDPRVAARLAERGRVRAASRTWDRVVPRFEAWLTGSEVASTAA